MQRGEPVSGRRRDGRVPDRAAAHPGDPPHRVDADLGQGGQLGQHDVVQAALSQRCGVVSGGLGRHPETVLGGEADQPRHVVG